MRYWLYDDEGVLLRKFWSMDAAEKFLQEGYKITVVKREKKKALSVADLIAVCGEAPY
jgi:hypothetical protein